jgi:hypothetical protein
MTGSKPLSRLARRPALDLGTYESQNRGEPEGPPPYSLLGWLVIVAFTPGSIADISSGSDARQRRGVLKRLGMHRRSTKPPVFCAIARDLTILPHGRRAARGV